LAPSPTDLIDGRLKLTKVFHGATNLTVAGVWPILSGHYGVKKFSLRSVILIDRPSGLDCALRSPSARAGTRSTQNLVYTFPDYSCFVGQRLPGGAKLGSKGRRYTAAWCSQNPASVARPRLYGKSLLFENVARETDLCRRQPGTTTLSKKPRTGSLPHPDTSPPKLPDQG